MYPPIFPSDPGLPLLPDSLTHRPWLSPTDRAATGLEEEGGRRAQSCSTSCCMHRATDWPAASSRAWWGGGVERKTCSVVSAGLSSVSYCLRLDKCCWQQTLKEPITCRVLVICPDSAGGIGGGGRLVPVIQSERRIFWGADGEPSDGASERASLAQPHSLTAEVLNPLTWFHSSY